MNKIDIDDVIQERSGLIKKAQELGFKPVCPKIPASDKKPSIDGFMGRYYNWKRELNQFELSNPVISE